MRFCPEQDQFFVTDNRHRLDVAVVNGHLTISAQAIQGNGCGDISATGIHVGGLVGYPQVAIFRIVDPALGGNVELVAGYVEQRIELVISTRSKSMVDSIVQVAIQIEERIIQVRLGSGRISLVGGYPGIQRIYRIGQTGGVAVDTHEETSAQTESKSIARRVQITNGIVENSAYAGKRFLVATGESSEVVGIADIQADTIVELTVGGQQEMVTPNKLGEARKTGNLRRAERSAGIFDGLFQNVRLSYCPVIGGKATGGQEAVVVEGGTLGSEKLPGVAGVGTAQVVVLASDHTGGPVVEGHVVPHDGLQARSE